MQVVPDDIVEQGREALETVKANPTLMAILIGVGVLTAVIFVWGLFKHAVKAAVIGGLLSVGAWYWYFNIR